MLLPELIQSQFGIDLAKEPAGAPLPGMAEFHLREFDADDVLIINLNGTLGGKQCHRAWQSLAMFKNIDGLLPGSFLLIVDLAQIKNRLLHDPATRAPFVFNDAPVAMLLAVFLPRRETQKHIGQQLCTDKKGWE